MSKFGVQMMMEKPLTVDDYVEAVKGPRKGQKGKIVKDHLPKGRALVLWATENEGKKYSKKSLKKIDGDEIAKRFEKETSSKIVKDKDDKTVQDIEHKNDSLEVAIIKDDLGQSTQQQSFEDTSALKNTTQAPIDSIEDKGLSYLLVLVS